MTFRDIIIAPCAEDPDLPPATKIRSTQTSSHISHPKLQTISLVTSRHTRKEFYLQTPWRKREAQGRSLTHYTHYTHSHTNSLPEIMTIGSVQLLAKSFSCRVTLSHWKNAAAVRCKVPRTCPTLRTISSTTRVEKSVQSPSSRDETPPQPPPPSESGLFRLLSAQERELLLEQRNLTATARKLSNQVLRGLEYSSITSTSSSSTNPSAIQQAASTLSQFVSTSSPSSSASFLDGLNLEASFSVVVAGEFNAGKSTLINALLGFKLLESGALPTTDTITIVTSSSSSQQQQQSSSSSSSQLPLGVTLHNVPNVPILQDVTLIDTPGTNSAWIDHTERTLRLLPSADMILFVTSADRPFPQSERTLLAGIQSYRKSIVMVVNKMDILNADGGDHGKSSKQAVVDFVTEQSSELLGARPIVIPVSARDALSSKLMEKKTTTTSTITNHPNHHSTQSLQHSSLMDPQQQQQQQRSNVWYRSNFAQLESFLKESLTTQTKLKSKLMNPIGVSEGMMKQCLDLLSHQQQDLQADITTLHVLETQLDGWKTELTFDLKLFCQKAMEMVQSQGDRWNILLARMNYWTFHYWFLIDHVRLEQEWIDTQRTVSLHRPHQLQPPAKKQQQPSNAKEEQDGWKDDLLVEVKEIA